MLLGQEEQERCELVGVKYPGAQIVQFVEPAVLTYPVGHILQTPEETAPMELLYHPALQDKQTEEPGIATTKMY